MEELQKVLVDEVLVDYELDVPLEIYTCIEVNLVCSDRAKAVTKLSELHSVKCHLKRHNYCVVLDPNVFCQVFMK